MEHIEILKDFLNETNACVEVCDDDTFTKILCSPFNWQNGVCDEDCNFAGCNFDGGDCNQLCNIDSPDCYSISLFDNGICDVACNTSLCDYDKYECITESVLNISFAKNMTYCNDDHDELELCLVSWVDDKWCDNNCRASDSCFNDGNDCNCDDSSDSDSHCQTLLSLFGFMADTTSDTGTLRISEAGICGLWELLDIYHTSSTFGSTPLETSVYKEIVNYYYQNGNCSDAFLVLDIDDNSYVEMQEFVITFANGFNFTYERAVQVNCTFAYDC